MIILGLTGSIGMGKSTIAAMFAKQGCAVFDSDACVHALMAPGGRALPAVARAFPDAVCDGAIDRQALGRAIFEADGGKVQLEAILHPLVFQAQRSFLAQSLRRRVRIAVLDVPLLFETGGDRRCDASVVVTAPYFVQRSRVLARPGMTAAKFAGILAAQMPDREKRRRADFIVQTGLGYRFARRQVQRICRRATKKGRC